MAREVIVPPRTEDPLERYRFFKTICREINSIVTGVLSKFSYSGNRTYVTNVSTARAIDRTSDVIIATTTVSNTAAETTIWTGTVAADALKAGNTLKIICSGELSNATAADDLTIGIKMGSTTITSYNPAIGNVTSADWRLDQILTIRSVGGSGSIAFHGRIEIDGNANDNNSIETIDTTAAEDLTVTITWDNAKVGNTISIYQGMLEWKN